MRLIQTRPAPPGRRTILAAGLAGAAAALAAAFRLLPGEPQTARRELDAAAQGRTVSRLDRTIWGYQELARTNPTNADARATLADAYIQKARETGDPTYYRKAEQMTREALAIDPEHIDALIAEGTLALARHQFREALAIGLHAQQVAPLVVAVYGVIADAQIELGLYGHAERTIQTMVDKRPDLASYSRVSYIRELNGDMPGAIDAMDRAVRAGGAAAEHVEWTRVQLGNLHFQRGDLERAEQAYLLALQQLPDYVFALAGLARVLAARGALNASIEAYRQAIARMPLPEFVIGLGELFEASGQRQAAEEQYRLVRAMQQLFQASGVNTDLELALFEADHGNDPAAAVAIARAAYEHRPGIKGADALAWALYKQGRFGEARRYAEQALRLGTQDAMLFFHAGMIAAADRDAAQATTYLQRCISLNSAFSPLHAPLVYAALAALTQPEARQRPGR